MANPIITAEDARHYLNYDPIQGHLTWRVSFRTNVAGARAGCLHKSTGYWRVGLLGGKFSGHRLTWLIVHGGWPNVIDHINGDKLDNRLENLRSVNYLINNQNIKRSPIKLKTSALGAHWHKRSETWASKIKWEGRTVHIGMFRTEREAHQAYIQAKRLLHEGNTL